MNIVFNINTLGMIGLGATLTSLIRNCSRSKSLTLWFLCSKVGEKDKRNIQKLLDFESFEGDVEFIDFNAEEKFGHLKSLHGDWTAYGRLLIPDLIKSEMAVYLDSDLIINTDILELENFKTDKALSAVFGSEVHNVLDGPFLIKKLKWPPDTCYFNSGVLLFNIPSWNGGDTNTKIERIAEQYPNEFRAADQTLLNALCKGDFAHLPKKFNVGWNPGSPEPENTDKSIVHFVGSPKPWDFCGKIIHKGHGCWEAYSNPFWRSQYSGMSAGNLRRTWKIRRSILRHLKRKLQPQ